MVLNPGGLCLPGRSLGARLRLYHCSPPAAGRGASAAQSRASKEVPPQGPGPPPPGPLAGWARVVTSKVRTRLPDAVPFRLFPRRDTTGTPAQCLLWLRVPDDRPRRAFSLESLVRRLVPPPAAILPVLRVSVGCSDLQVGGAPPHVALRLLDKHHKGKVTARGAPAQRLPSRPWGLAHQTRTRGCARAGLLLDWGRLSLHLLTLTDLVETAHGCWPWARAKPWPETTAGPGPGLTGPGLDWPGWSLPRPGPAGSQPPTCSRLSPEAGLQPP